MTEQDNLQYKEQPSSGETALINQAQTNAPVNAPAQPPRRKHLFAKGFAFGMGVMLVICMMLFVVLMLTRRVYISGRAGLADAELIAKTESIAYYLKGHSLYDYDPDTLRDGMLDGLLVATGDKYAHYYNTQELADLMNDYEGNFCGLGVLIKQSEDGDVYVSGTYKDSPAEEAGFTEGDVFKAVDGVDVEGWTRYDVAELIRGEEGTSVTITVYRESTGETLDLTATRKQLKKIDVEYRMVSDTTGYIWIKDFDEVAIEQFAEALADLRSQGMEDMILDLRTNTGGLLRAVLDITRQIMCKGVIVSTRNAQGETDSYKCDGRNEFTGRIIILTDGYTASASEILVGALKDHGMAISMGTTTYGKGVVQDFFYLSDASGIKFTTEEYLTPNGTAIDGVGIEPDIVVEFDYESYVKDKTDNQLEAAIEYMENK
ncbi:MAG: S41 family peptidase [Lachnospiraceae bacterium]|nr:S41 family peptidase [Lachnospiraceae bacterium]